MTIKLVRQRVRWRLSRKSQEVARGFLDPDDLDEFVKEYPMFPRTLVAERRNRREKRQEVGDAACDLVQTGNTAFRCGIVAVNRNDGMSWAATAADRAVAEAHPGVTRIHLRGVGSTARLPAIGGWVSPRVLAREARRAGLTKRFPVMSGWLLIAPVVTVSAGLFHAWSRSGFELATLGDPLLIACVAVGAAFELVREAVVARATDSASPDMQELATAYADAPASNPEGYAQVVRALAKRLALGPFPRFVVVDDFGRLDATTSAVMRNYLRNHAGRNGAEGWILFVEADEKAIWNETLGAATRRLRSYDLELLTDGERRRLAAYAGNDRFDYATVRGVRGGTGFEEGDELDRFLLDLRLSSQPPTSGIGELELFYLLSLTAAWGRGPTLSVPELEGKLRKGGKARTELLEQFLGSEPTLHELRTSMRAMTKRLGRLVEETVPDGSGFDRELEFHQADVGRALAAGAYRHGLPPAGLGHLFWAIFWHDWLRPRPVEAFWTQRLAVHLLEGLPSVHDHDPSEQVVDALFGCVVDVIRWCIQSCVLEHVGDILQAALVLVDDDPAAERRAERLLRLAWEAYGVLGDEQLLGTILAIEAWRAPDTSTPTRAPSSTLVRSLSQSSSSVGTSSISTDGWNGRPAHPDAEDALERVFLQSLSVDQSRVVDSWRHVLSKRDDAAASLSAYGNARGAWLTATVTGVGRWADVRADQLLPAALEDACTRLDSVVLESCARLDPSSADTHLVAIDYLGASIGLWSLALLQSSRPAVFEHTMDIRIARLAEARRIAATLYEAALASGTQGNGDLLVHVLARELLVVIAAASTMMALTSERSAATQLIGIARSALDGLGGATSDSVARRARSIVREIRRQLDLLAVTWGRLGVPRLSAYADLRSAQYSLVHAPQANLDVYTRLSKALSPEVGHTGHVELLARMTLASAATWSGDITARLLGLAAQKAIADGLGDDLATEMALLALHAGHANRVEMEEVLGYLTDIRNGDARSRLAVWLARATDDELGHIALVLINALRNSPDRPDLVTEVTRAVEERRATASDLNVIQKVVEEIEVWKLQIELQSGVAVDVEQTMASWKERDRSNYAWVLYLLTERSQSPVLEEEAAIMLEGTEPPALESAFALLAIANGDRGGPYGGESGDRVARASVEFLVSAMDHWQDRFRIGMNIRGYRLLRDHDPARRDHYEKRLLHWDLAQHEVDALGTVPSLYEQGRYFTLFSHFCESLFRWGLPVDHMHEIRKGRGQSDEDARLILDEWLREGAIVPAAFAVGDEPPRLSARFVVLGRLAFRLADDSSEIEDAQFEFDDVARRSMETLYAVITTLGSIPDEIRQVFSGYRDRFANHTTLS